MKFLNLYYTVQSDFGSCKEDVDEYQWSKDEDFCRDYLLNCLSSRLAETYSQLKTAKEIWDALDTQFKKEEDLSKIHLVDKFMAFTFDESKLILPQYRRGVADLLFMPLSRNHHRSHAAALGGVAATSYPVHAWNHRNHYGTPRDDVLAPSAKRRKSTAPSWEDGWKCHQNFESSCRTFVKPQFPAVHCDYTGIVAVSSCSQLDDDDMLVMSRDEIDRCSPSRKDGINRYMETLLRYSYCAFLQSLGMRLDLPQATVGTAMVLCHRFFLRRSHASHDRFLIATTALFLAAKTEETPCQLNSVLSASCEIYQKHSFTFLPQLTQDWFKLSRERIIEAEQLILITLNFELEVEHPYVSLTSVLNKLGLSQTVLLNMAWSLVNEGVFKGLVCSNV